MKRFLSWIVLCIISWLVSLATGLVVVLYAYLLHLIVDLNLFWRVIIYLFGGTAGFYILFIPIRFGLRLVFEASESIKPSRKGTRYFVYSIYRLIVNTLIIILGLIEGDIRISAILMCVYFIKLIILGRRIKEIEKLIREYGQA